MDETAGREARHSIGVVARRTGLSTEVIRAWEQRYGAVEPTRTEGGQRLYAEADVRRLRLLAAAVEAGHRIGAIATLPDDALAQTVRQLGGEPPAREPGRTSDTLLASPAFLAVAIEAAAEADARLLRDCLRRAAVMLEPMRFIEEVLVPFLESVGERWAAGEVTPAHEHVASVVVRGILDWLLDTTAVASGAPLLLVATPSGERHEFGSLLAAVTASQAGWSVLSAGGDLPASDLAKLAVQKRASAVAVSVVYAASGDAGAELARLRRELPSHVPVLVGGRASSRVAPDEAGIERFGDLRSLRTRLEASAAGVTTS